MASNTRLKAVSKAAVAAEQWPSRSHLSSFIRCLHLLNLDLLEDWPDVTVQTLSTRSAAQNLQQRVKAVEWSLFRLFEVYDAQLTRDKLRPFFPPQSHLQSQNLRAALLRVLTDLKRTGILERDAVLRKTTFDECKGERFEELLSGFANLVLRKQLHGRLPTVIPSLTGSEVNRIPLIVAHRALLRAALDQRQDLVAKLRDHERNICDRRDRLSSARRELRRHKPPDYNLHGDVERILRDSWTADPAWVNALLRDFPARLSQPGQKNTSPSDSEGEPVMQRLEDLLTEREAHLKRWVSFKALLPTADAGPSEPRIQKTRVHADLRFDKHKDLHPGNAATKTLKDTAEKSHTQRRYANLMSELSNAWHSEESGNPTRMVGDEAAMEEVSVQAGQKPASAGRLLPKAWITPEPDLTLPSAFQRDRNHLHGSPTGDQSAAVESHPLQEGTLVEAPFDNKTLTPEPPRLARGHMLANGSADESPNATVVDTAERSVHRGPPATPLTERSHNLQERTRTSLAGVLRDVDHIPTSPMLPKQKPSKREEDFLASPPEIHKDEGSLAQRTRKSMSLLTTIADMKSNRRKSKGSRVSQLYPVDPFQTPRRSSSQISLHTPGSSDSTPREKLFSDDADINSVFKSRPKIAMSPLISPTRSHFREDSVLASKAGDLYLDEDETDSPV